MKNDEKRVINGTFGRMWLDGELVRETTGLKAESTPEFGDVNMCGDLNKHQKLTGFNNTGSVTMNKCNSRMALKIADSYKKGKVPYFTIVSDLADPDAYGAERVVLKDCVFTNFTLIDWQAKQFGTVTQNFTFGDYEFIDLITPQD